MATTPPLLLGTVLALLGFLQWPKGGLELLRPRIVIPLLVWLSIFGQFILNLVDSGETDKYTYYHNLSDGAAMWFGCYCLMAFWVGFLLPFGRLMSSAFTKLPRGLNVDPERLRPLGLVACTIPFLVQFGLAGTTIFKASNFQFESRRFWLPDSIGKIVAIMIDLIAIFGVVLIGFAWPAKGKRTPALLLGHFVALSLVLHVFICRFSRASGVSLMLAYAAASVRFKKVKVWLGILLVLITFMLAHTGLTGRSIYGHFAGSFYFMEHFLSYTIWEPMEILEVGLGSADSLQPLAVIITGLETTDINALPKWKWLLSQLPVPRALGLPAWTTDASIIIGGHYSHPFWFTMSMYGDLYAHFGYLGAMGFAWVGIMYRFVDSLVARFGKSREEEIYSAYYPTLFSPTQLGAAFYHINFYLLFMVMTYAALNRGIFNSFRAWWILFVYMTYALIIGQIIVKLSFPSRE